MAFKLGRQRRKTSFTDVVGLKDKIKIFDSSGALDSDFHKHSLKSGAWKKTMTSSVFTNNFYGTQPDQFSYLRIGENYLDKDPSNFTISDNVNIFQDVAGQFFEPNHPYAEYSPDADGVIPFSEADRGIGLSKSELDGRGAQWGIPLFHHPFHYTSRNGERRFSTQYKNSYDRSNYLREVIYVDKLNGYNYPSGYYYQTDSNYSALVRGFNDLRPSSLLEPEAWTTISKPQSGLARSNNVHYRYDWFRHKNLQYFQLITQHPTDIENDMNTLLSPDVYGTIRKTLPPTGSAATVNEADDYLLDDATKNPGPAHSKRYGKVIGYVLEPGRSIIENKLGYNGWQHDDQLGHGKWAGNSTPKVTMLDSDVRLGIRRSFARRNKDYYLQGERGYYYNTSSNPSTETLNDQYERYSVVAYGANEKNRADPYVGMTIGSPCMLQYFGKDPTNGGSTSWSNILTNKTPVLAVLGGNQDPSELGNRYWQMGNYNGEPAYGLATWNKESNNSYIDESYILQDFIDSSAVNWSGGKGWAPLQETGTASFEYPYVVADYMPSRTMYNRKGENVLYDTQINNDAYFFNNPSREVMELKDVYRVVTTLFTSPKNFSVNDWGDSIATSNAKDVMVINNFDSDAIVLHMVRDWDCWRR